MKIKNTYIFKLDLTPVQRKYHSVLYTDIFNYQPSRHKERILEHTREKDDQTLPNRRSSQHYYPQNSPKLQNQGTNCWHVFCTTSMKDAKNISHKFLFKRKSNNDIHGEREKVCKKEFQVVSATVLCVKQNQRFFFFF